MEFNHLASVLLAFHYEGAVCSYPKDDLQRLPATSFSLIGMKSTSRDSAFILSLLRHKQQVVTSHKFSYLFNIRLLNCILLHYNCACMLAKNAKEPTMSYMSHSATQETRCPFLSTDTLA